MDREDLATVYPSQYSTVHVPFYEHNSQSSFLDGPTSQIKASYLHSTPSPLTSTPTSMAPSTYESNNRMTRSSRSPRQDSTTPTTRARTRSPSPRRVAVKKTGKASKAKRDGIPQLSGALSIITKNMTVPVRDMQAWVNRPAEVRYQEVANKKGHISRPMNSFMLYRSAYADRTKAWCAENNHQIVSSVSGASWPMEPPEVRDFYNELAKIERVNHQAAHPDYKFSPAKPVNKRKVHESEDSDDNGERDPDGDWATTHRVRTSRPRAGKNVRYPTPNKTTLEQVGGLHGSYMTVPDAFANAPQWEVPWQSQMSNGYSSQYILHQQNQAYPYGMQYPGAVMSAYGQQLGSNLSSRAPTPLPSSLPSQTHQSLGSGAPVGLPGRMNHHHILGEHLQDDQILQPLEGPIDPSLATYDGRGMLTSMGGGVALPYDGSYGYADNETPDPPHVDNYRSHPREGASTLTRSHPEQVSYQPKEWNPDNNDETGGAVGQTREFDEFWAGMPAGEIEPDGQPIEPGVQAEDPHLDELFGERGDEFSVSENVTLPANEQDAEGEEVLGLMPPEYALRPNVKANLDDAKSPKTL